MTAEPILCYVDDQWAYFTDQPLAKQWGDDWNDVPYEHNAGTPYEHNGERITKLAWDGNFEDPSEGHCNSPYSVQMINAGCVAWLRSSKWSDDPIVAIPAGTPLSQFKALIQSKGGKVYVEDKP